MESLCAIGNPPHRRDSVIGLPDRIDIVPALVVERRPCAAEHKAACFTDDWLLEGVRNPRFTNFGLFFLQNL